MKAKSFYRYQAHQPVQTPAFYENQDWQLIINGKNATENIDDTFKDRIHDEAMKQFLSKEKNEVIHETFDMIDWKAMGKAVEMITNSRCIWYVKYVSGFLPTGNHISNRGEWEDALCPICRQVTENSVHLTQCMECEAVEFRKSVVFELNEWLEK